MTESWDDWREHYRGLGIREPKLCKDGILNPEAYQASKPRLLFVLKESNHYEGDLREIVKDGPKFQMWHAISRWAAAIHLGFPRYQEVDDWDTRRAALDSIATVNLRKTAGEASADMDVVNAFAYRSRELLRQQIAEIGPQVILSCGVWGSLLWLLDIDVDPQDPWKQPIYSERWGAWIVPWRHPNRSDNKRSHKELKSMFKQVPLCQRA